MQMTQRLWHAERIFVLVLREKGSGIEESEEDSEVPRDGVDKRDEVYGLL